jgi:NAD(P)-dependent dehydrogenase (short-subunit alcohol dehydrogenase family)
LTAITRASRGIGAAVAGKLNAAGVRVGRASRLGDDLGVDAVAMACDVRPQPPAEAAADFSASSATGWVHLSIHERLRSLKGAETLTRTAEWGVP